VEAVAQEVGVALHVTRLLEENRERLERQTALLRAAEVLTAELELDTVLERLVDLLADLVGADAADCYLYDASRGVLRCAAVHGLPEDLVGFEFPLGKGLATPAIAGGRPVISADYDRLAEPVPHEAYREFGTAAIAPMRWNDDVQGVLGVGRRGDRPFDVADGDALEVFAGLASLALQNAETFAQSSRQARVQRGFYRIASVLGQSLSRRATLTAVAQAATEALGGDFGAVLTPTAGRLELAGAFELPPAVAEFFEGGAPETGALVASAAERRILAAPIVRDDDRFTPEWRELAADIPYNALLSVPVDLPRHAGGGLVLVFFNSQRFFTDDDLELARHLANAARGALERSDLYEAERTSRTLSQQLARTGSLLATELDPASVLDEVVHQAPSLLGADACAIRVLEGDELVVSAAEGPGAREAVGARSSTDVGPSGDVIQTRAPVTADDALHERRLRERDPMFAAGHSCYLGVPLVGPEGVLHGVLAVYARGPREWRPEEVEALRALAANTSAALSNAELYQRVALEKERSFAILANIADGIVAVDRDGRVVLWNAAAEAITGVPADEALGRTTAQALQRALESDAEMPMGDRLVSIQRDGEEVWLSLTEAVMRDPAGIVAGRIFAFRDISTERLVEQMKSEFVSAVSHELRTPLTSIYGFAETLLRQDVLFGEEERRIFLGYIASESQRLTSIVDALLNVARLDTGDLHVSLAPTDVRAIVSEVVADADTNGHEFVVDLPEEPVAVEADREKLRQVFVILVDNAVKYSPEGGRVVVGAARKDETVEVRVVDEGPGIPQSEQERIFRKFYRGDAGSRLGAAGGTGLGLFIAQGLVTAMGGRIWVASNEGSGSSFGVELPAANEGSVGRKVDTARNA
jgi:PAS domain S-box-containing protein